MSVADRKSGRCSRARSLRFTLDLGLCRWLDSLAVFHNQRVFLSALVRRDELPMNSVVLAFEFEDRWTERSDGKQLSMAMSPLIHETDRCWSRSELPHPSQLDDLAKDKTSPLSNDCVPVLVALKRRSLRPSCPQLHLRHCRLSSLRNEYRNRCKNLRTGAPEIERKPLSFAALMSTRRSRGWPFSDRPWDLLERDFLILSTLCLVSRRAIGRASAPALHRPCGVPFSR